LSGFYNPKVVQIM